MAQTNKDQDSMEKSSKSESTSSEILEGTLADDSTQDSQAASANKASQSTLKKHEKRDSSKDEDAKNPSSSSKSSKSSSKLTPTRTSRLASFVLLLLVVFSLFLLLMGMQNTQALNELRNDLNQVQHKQDNIMDQQDVLSGQVAATPSSSSEQLQILEKLNVDVAQLQKQVQAESDNSAMEGLQSRQAEFESKIQSELQQALETVKTLQTPVQTSEGEVDLSPLMQKIAMLEQQFNSLNQQVAESQVIESTDVKPDVNQDEKSQLMVNPLSLQQWIFETNTQWLLGASAEATIEKLNAIEQAAVNGGLPKVTALARLIGQDIATLKQWFEMSKQPLPPLDELYSAVSALAPPKLELQQAESMPQANTQAVQTDALQVGEVAEQETAWQRLLSRLSEMVTIKNRQTTGEPTTVEALLQHDLLKQRLLLLIERMQWSAQHESQARFEMSIDQVQKFVNQNFSDNSKQFEGLLQPFRAFERKGRQPLVTAGFHVKPSNN